MEIVIASNNVHKIREFREMLKAIKGVDVFSLLNFPKYEPLEETGATFQENAQLKARHAAVHLKKWVLADDSGLVVPPLQGSPGVHSKRYAGPEATDADNRKKLLREMQHLTGLQRCAYFECCLVLCDPSGSEKCVSGICEGHILTEERGRNGFGYDSLFVKNDYDKTFAEITEAVKNRISHRCKAFEKLRIILEGLAVAE